MVAISRLLLVMIFIISARCQEFTSSVFKETTLFHNVSIATDQMLNVSVKSVTRCCLQCLQSVNCSWVSYLKSGHSCHLHFNRDIIGSKPLAGMRHLVASADTNSLRLYAYNGTMFAGDHVNTEGMDADDWLKNSAIQVSTTNWRANTYKQMFYFDHEYLLAIFNDKIWKGKLNPNTVNWLTEAIAIGQGDWGALQWPFVDKAKTYLYVVRKQGTMGRVWIPGRNDLILETVPSSINWKDEFIKLFANFDNQMFAIKPNGDMHRGTIPDTNTGQTWVDNSVKVGTSEWLGYKFLSFLPSGILLAVKTSGEMYMGNSPEVGRAWLPEAVLLGHGWDRFEFLLVRPDN